MPEKIFTGGYVTTYPEWPTGHSGSLIGVPGEVAESETFPDDGNWADLPKPQAAAPATAPAPAPAPAPPAPAKAPEPAKEG